jgi:PilM
MWTVFTVCAFAAASGYFLLAHELKNLVTPGERIAVPAATNLATYRAAVVNFVMQHPGAVVDGSVEDGALSFPQWFTRFPQWHNYVVGSRMVVVYGSLPEAAGLAEEVAKVARGSMLAGRALPGYSPTGAPALTLHSPAQGDTAIVLPSVVPDGSAVWLASLD